jgi:hypothetical protein
LLRQRAFKPDGAGPAQWLAEVGEVRVRPCDDLVHLAALLEYAEVGVHAKPFNPVVGDDADVGIAEKPLTHVVLFVRVLTDDVLYSIRC